MGDTAGNLDLYGIRDYAGMLADEVRMRAYERALASEITPGALVLDLGAGTGVFALMAARLGARRVVAVEPNDAIQVAREIAAANGLGDRIEFIQDVSTSLALDERADVIVSDLRGVTPLHLQHVPSIIDARERLLVPSGRMIPREDVLFAAVVEDARAYDTFVDVWRDPHWGFDMDAARRLVSNTWWGTFVDQEQLLSRPAVWARLDYTCITQADAQGEIELLLTRPGKAHGLAIWFETTLAEGVSFSTAPGTKLVYRQAFFPLEEPVEARAGDRAFVRIHAAGTAADYVWRWQTAISRGDSTIAAFDQCTLNHLVITPDLLRRTVATHSPLLNEDGDVVRFVLERMTGGSSLERIAEELHTKYPNHFRSYDSALKRVTDLAVRYGE
jgi:protein arginine N-methyltransferase 1